MNIFHRDMKPRMSFIPRVVQKNALAQPSLTPEAPKSTTKVSTNGSNSTTGDSTLQTNDDFRKFLTQSK